MSITNHVRSTLRRLPQPVRVRLIAGRNSLRRGASRVSRTRTGAVVFDTYVTLRTSSTTRPLRELLDRSTPFLLSSSTTQWYRLQAGGGHRYLLTIETEDDLPGDSRALLVQYRFISGRGRVRRNIDTGKAWSLRDGYHEFVPRVPRNRVSTLLILTPPGVRLVDIGLSARREPVTIRQVGRRDIGPRTPVDPYDLPVAPPRTSLRLAVVADTFTVTALRMEAHVYEIPAAGWDADLVRFAPDLVLVESAWNGNDGAWQYRLAGMKPDDRHLADLVASARQAGVPVLFWNKEDPAHYDDFIAAASLCDVVATTDADMIPRYRADLGHDRVVALPFCIQTDIHNPRQPNDGREPRLPGAGFLGSWWADKFDARREAQIALFEGSADFGLEIFDRYLTFNDHERYRIPPEWLSFVHGSLTYQQALSAYRRYSVLLNVNTVTDSPTMFSRRALEAAACGAVVVTNPSAGTGAALGDFVITAGTAGECRTALAGLAERPGDRDRLAHRAYRHVHRHHTWAERLEVVTTACNISLPRRSRPKVSVVLATKRRPDCDRTIRYLASLDDPSLEIEPIIVAAFDPVDLETGPELERLGAIVFQERPGETLGECLNRGAAASSGEFIAKIDDDDIYGPHYFGDLLIAMNHSRADIVGKHSHYQYFETGDTTVLRYPDCEHRFTTFVCGSTLLVRRHVYDTVQFPRQRVGEDTEFLRRAIAGGMRLYSADRFNYVSRRRADLDSHTWQQDHDALLNSPMTRRECTGLPVEHLRA